MRVGNRSQVTPRKYYIKLNEHELNKLATKALLLSGTHSNEFYTYLNIKVPTWYSKGKPENSIFKIKGKDTIAIYLDINDYSTKPGVIAEWQIRIFK